MKNKILKTSIILTFLAAIFFGCSSQMSYSPSSTYAESDFRDINDEDILKAFQAAPQIKIPVKVAWYNMSRDDLYQSIKFKDENVIENYQISKTLIEGFQPLFNDQQYQNFHSPQPINFKAVRLMAARAKCDIVILVSSRFEEKRDLNGWATFNILILPTLFTPYLNIEYRYSTEVFVFDVRNGYLYKHLKYSDAQKQKLINIWEVEELAQKINNNMIKTSSEYLKKELKMLLKNNSNIDK